MAKKIDVLNSVLAAVAAFGKENKFTKEQAAGLAALLNDLLAPKSAGLSVNLDDVTKRDANGKITHIMCSLSGKFLPATAEFFYEDKHGKGVGETGLKRLSRQAEAIRKQHLKLVATSERAIMNDTIDKKISAEEARKKLEALKNSKPDYSKVTDKPAPKENKAEAKESKPKAEAKESKPKAEVRS